MPFRSTLTYEQTYSPTDKVLKLDASYPRKGSFDSNRPLIPNAGRQGSGPDIYLQEDDKSIVSVGSSLRPALQSLTSHDRQNLADEAKQETVKRRIACDCIYSLPSKHTYSIKNPDSSPTEPIVLQFQREGPYHTVLFDPTIEQAIYRFHNHGRERASLNSDFHVTRVTPGGGNIGKIKTVLGKVEITFASSDQKSTDVTSFQPSHLRENQEGQTLIWQCRQGVQKRQKDHQNGTAEHQSTKEALFVELFEEANRSSGPLCRITLYDRRPLGSLEIFAESACVDHHKGNWAALDELVLSAFANMEVARRRFKKREFVYGHGGT